jgi:hypothetical protein
MDKPSNIEPTNFRYRGYRESIKLVSPIRAAMGDFARIKSKLEANGELYSSLAPFSSVIDEDGLGSVIPLIMDCIQQLRFRTFIET